MAYEVLGPEHRPLTEFYTDGFVQHGVLLGNLWVKGGGDLSLGSKFFYSDSLKYQRIEHWKEELLALGIREIDGVVYFDGSAFGYDPIPKGWSHHDFGNYYAVIFLQGIFHGSTWHIKSLDQKSSHEDRKNQRGTNNRD